MPDALHPPQRRTPRAGIASPGLRNSYGKTKGREKKAQARRIYAADSARPAHVPALLSDRFVLDAATDRPKLPARLVLSARAQEDGAGKAAHLKPPDFLRLKPCSDYGKITENRAAGPPCICDLR